MWFAAATWGAVDRQRAICRSNRMSDVAAYRRRCVGARGVRGAVSVRCFVSRGARGAVFREARGKRTARGKRGARGVCGAVFRDTLH